MSSGCLVVMVVAEGVKHMRVKQKGLTAISFLVLAAMIGVIGLAGLKLVPVYLENMKIKKILTDVKAEFDGQSPTPAELRRALDRKLDIEMVYSLEGRDFNIQSTGDGVIVGARYERPESFIGNISLLVSFDNEVEIRK